MLLLRLLPFLALASAWARAHSSLRSTKNRVISTSTAGVSFEDFVRDFGRSYSAGTDEYHQRASLFQTSLARVNAKNAMEAKSWVAGVHNFMDWTPEELRSLQGYKPSSDHHRARSSMLQTGAGSRSQLNASAIFQDEVIGEGTEHRSQGQCGSCWAISAAEAVEAQLKKSGRDVRVSPQALVDCVANPQHCGGSGGCNGATGELAFAFMQKHGIPLESDLPYRKSSSFGGPSQEDSVCKMEPSGQYYPSKKRVMVDGWESLQSNRAEGLMQALVQEGSAVVAVDANDWFDYHSGVYDGCSKDATLVHAVLAKGYGKDTGEGKSGKKFWLIQNSWGAGWGEKGDIRLLRHEKDDEWCGNDKDPSKGLGCDDGPPSVEVCGMCGILYDPVVPKGVRVVDDEEVGSLARVSKGDYTAWHP